MRNSFAITVLAVLFLCAGCCGKKESAAPRSPSAQAVVENANTLMMSGNTNAAVEKLRSAIGSKTYRAERAYLFTGYINMLMSADRLDEAKAEYLRTIPSDMPLAEAAFGRIDACLLSRQDFICLDDWTRKMFAAPFTGNVLVNACVNRMNALSLKGDIETAVAVISQCRDRLGDAQYTEVLSRTLNAILGRRNYDQAERFLAGIREIKPELTAVRDVIARARISIFAAQKQWKECEDLFRTSITNVSDECGSAMISIALVPMIADGRVDTVDSLSDLALASRKPDENSFSLAARHWISAVSIAEKSDRIIERFRRLQVSGLPPDKMFPLVEQPFYLLLTGNRTNDLKQMAFIIESIKDKLTQKPSKLRAQQLLMDFHFTRNDIDAAIRELESVEADKEDVAWKDKALAKLKAHKALKEGNRKEAIENFRVFMKLVSEGKFLETDPSSGMHYSVNWCLGRNAARIGDILKDDGNPAEAAKTYREANDYFQNALAETEPDSREREAIAAEIKQLAAKMK